VQRAGGAVRDLAGGEAGSDHEAGGARAFLLCRGAGRGRDVGACRPRHVAVVDGGRDRAGQGDGRAVLRPTAGAHEGLVDRGLDADRVARLDARGRGAAGLREPRIGLAGPATRRGRAARIGRRLPDGVIEVEIVRIDHRDLPRAVEPRREQREVHHGPRHQAVRGLVDARDRAHET
ncbi:hypothetical protein CON20_27435, partial [Priestia megaterium]